MDNLSKEELLLFSIRTSAEGKDSEDRLQQLTEELFELKEKYSKIIDDCHDYRHETHAMKMTIINLMEHFEVSNEEELKNIYLNKPYEFEELKPDMWVWDNAPKSKRYVKITSTNYETEMVRNKPITERLIVVAHNGYESYINFRQNHFYPREVK